MFTMTEDFDDMGEIRVKFVARGLRRGFRPDQYRRMLPDHSPVWGNCRFLFDVDEKDYDWLVVYHDIPDKDSLVIEHPRHCPREKTILITLEPSSVTVYGSDYVKQFGTVITFQESWALPHPNARRRAPGLMWYYGYSFDAGTALSYDQLRAEKPRKTHLISMMCSSRTGKVTLHTLRRNFSAKLQKDLPELDVFGHGIQRIDDKAEALRPYQYHIVVENHVCRHHLTEKLADAFLGYALPFYHGAPNTAEYFPRESFIPIDINDYAASLDIIKSTIANNEYEDRLPYIEEARRRVFEEMNMFSVIEREIGEYGNVSGPETGPGIIMNRRTLRLKKPVAGIKSLFEKAYVKTRHRIARILA